MAKRKKSSGPQLRAFVSDTIVQIVNGVIDAQGQIAGTGARVSPKPTAEGAGKLTKKGSLVETVDFDIAVNVTEVETLTGGVGLMIGPVILGARGKAKSKSGDTHRVRFSVPVAYPTTG